MRTLSLTLSSLLLAFSGHALAQKEVPAQSIHLGDRYTETTGVILTDISIHRSEQARLIREAARMGEQASGTLKAGQDLKEPPEDLPLSEARGEEETSLPAALAQVPLVPGSLPSPSPIVTGIPGTGGQVFRTLDEAAQAGVDPVINEPEPLVLSAQTDAASDPSKSVARLGDSCAAVAASTPNCRCPRGRGACGWATVVGRASPFSFLTAPVSP